MAGKSITLLFLILYFVLATQAVRRRNSNFKKESVKILRSARTRTEVFENLFNVYDPTYLSFVWSKITNGVHLFVEQRCWEDVSFFFRELSQGKAWAYKAVDASGRYKSSLLSGNTFWLGSKDQCFNVEYSHTLMDDTEIFGDNEGSINIRKKYFDGDMLDKNRKELMQRVMSSESIQSGFGYTTMKIALNITKASMAKIYNITLGVCLPKTCTPSDVSSIINFSIMINDNLRNNKTVPRSLKVLSLRRVENTYSILSDVGAIALICITGVLLILSILGTVIDLDVIKFTFYKSEEMTSHLQKYNNNYSMSENSTIEKDEFKSFKESNVIDLETLAINNMNNANNVNLITIKKVLKANASPPSITLDVVSMQKESNSCNRCGKYRKQCNNPINSDNWPSCPRVQQNSIASCSSGNKRRGVFSSLLVCFSLRHSWRMVFNTKTVNRDLSIIHGFRILATFWIIFVHVTVITSYVSENGDDINEYNNIYYILASGTMAFDTLLFVSGLFSSHHFFYLKSRYTIEELVSFGGACGHVLQYICFVTNRAVRLLPTYAFVVFLTAVTARLTHNTSVLELPEQDYSNCQSYWWRNLLYVTPFYSKDEQCMQMSWYLSLETELHAAAAFICATLYGSRNKMGFALIVLAVTSAAVVDINAAYSEYKLSFANAFAAYETIIDRPCSRVTSYFVGVLAGWLIHRMSGNLKLSKLNASCLWLACSATGIISILVPWLGQVWLSSWLHLSWPLALLWPAIVCATVYVDVAGHLLDSSLVAGLSRLSYSMILLHGVVARATLLSINLPLCPNTLCIWSYFTGITVCTGFAALLLSLLVEMPCCALLRRLSDCATSG